MNETRWDQERVPQRRRGRWGEWKGMWESFWSLPPPPAPPRWAHPELSRDRLGHVGRPGLGPAGSGVGAFLSRSGPRRTESLRAELGCGGTGDARQHAGVSGPPPPGPPPRPLSFLLCSSRAWQRLGPRLVPGAGEAERSAPGTAGSRAPPECMGARVVKLPVELKPEGGVGVVVFPQSGLKVYCFPSKTQLLAYRRSFMCWGGVCRIRH